MEQLCQRAFASSRLSTDTIMGINVKVINWPTARQSRDDDEVLTFCSYLGSTLACWSVYICN
jgi:hypothetical protein